MSQDVIAEFEGLVTISWHKELRAIYLKWHTEHDESGRVIEAVKCALEYVARNDVRNWWVDISTSPAGLTKSDQSWVQTEFPRLIAESPLEKLAMTPPLPETGQDTAWLDDWETDTNAKYGGQITARLVHSYADVQEHFAGT